MMSEYEIGQKIHFLSLHPEECNKAVIIGFPLINGKPGILLKYPEGCFVMQSDCLKTQSEIYTLIEEGVVKVTK